MAKTLPIQLVKTRGEQDVFLKEAGGSDELPSWVTTEIILDNAQRLTAGLDSIGEYFRNRTVRNSGLPLLLKARLSERATAKSYRPNVRAILNQNRKHNVIGVTGFRELLVKVDAPKDIEAIKTAVHSVLNLTAAKDKLVGIAAIEDLSRFSCDFDANNLADKVLKIQLADYNDANLNQRAEKILFEFGQELKCHIEKVRYAEDLVIFKVKRPTIEAISQLVTLDSIISIKAMPYYELVAAPDPCQADVELAKPVENEEYPIIGILDSGVESSEYLSPWRLDNEYNAADLDDYDINRTHGTMVASVAIYGDVLEQKEYTGCGPLKFVSCIVNTESQNISILEDELIMHIRDAVAKYPNVKIWNLSQGSSCEVSDFDFSDFAKALDDIQKQHNILICKSAGNSINNIGRITLGAESIRALTVGSVCNEGMHVDDLKEGLHSPFSRIGYGPESLIKPEIVHYGGNRHTGIKVLTGADFLHNQKGTSFSTPRVASLASHLYHRMGLPFDPTLIKALIVHNANYPLVVDKSVLNFDKLYGFGVPSTLDDMLNNDENEFTMVWQPNFNNKTDFQIIDFPYPESLVDEEGNLYGIVTVTVVTNPILKSVEGNEYCQSEIEVKLGPIESLHHYILGAVGTPKTYRNEDRIKMFNILTVDKYSKRQPELMRERNLILQRHKWHPVKKYQVDLSSLRPAIKNKIQEQQKWAMVIRSLTRDASTLELHEDGVVNEISATIIVTIRDPKNKGVVYSEGIRLLNSRNFEHSDIRINNEIQLSGNLET